MSNLHPVLCELLDMVIDLRASDMWLLSGYVPYYRKYGEVVKMDTIKLDEISINELFADILPESKTIILKEKGYADISIQFKDYRFRVCLSRQQMGSMASIRALPPLPEDFSTFGIPEQVLSLSSLRNGLVLVTGTTGSGKSTTLASILEGINKTRNVHIITLEDPVEYRFFPKQALFTQKEIETDIPNFVSGLKAALRENPDVIVVGEMRDIETMRLAIEAANTGHLVFATLHTKSAYETVYRILNAFPGGETDLIRDILSDCIQAVVSQILIPKTDKSGLFPVFEIFFTTPAVKNVIKDNKLLQLKGVMESSVLSGKAVLFEDELIKHIENGDINKQDALMYVFDEKYFSQRARMKGLAF